MFIQNFTSDPMSELQFLQWNSAGCCLETGGDGILISLNVVSTRSQLSFYLLLICFICCHTFVAQSLCHVCAMSSFVLWCWLQPASVSLAQIAGAKKALVEGKGAAGDGAGNVLEGALQRNPHWLYKSSFTSWILCFICSCFYLYIYIYIHIYVCSACFR